MLRLQSKAVVGAVSSVAVLGAGILAHPQSSLLLGSHEYVPQGPKLVGSGAVGAARQAGSVSLSADGNTALIGGSLDDTNTGGAWVWIRTNGLWAQQGPRLVDAAARQGTSVSLSADGNTALIGGFLDEFARGAAWVWTRSDGVWTQQGPKLVGSGSVGSSVYQGVSVSLSADGNTALIGGSADNNFVGAAWVWTRSGGVWTQQGSKLVGPPDTGFFGAAVALSGDGNTAIIGAPRYNNSAGASWIYTRSGGVWTQQGQPLTGSDAVGTEIFQGVSVSLSADGNTAAIGGSRDNSSIGAAWVFTRNGGVWTQQGAKLIASDAVGNAGQGTAVDLSADGATLLVGGGGDNTSMGAVWVWTRTNGAWTQSGPKLVGTGAVGPTVFQGSAASLSANATTVLVGGSGDDNHIGAAWVFVASGAFTDDPLMPGVSVVKAVHITELRQRIEALRTAYGLAAFPWTDSTLTVGVTWVKAQHIVDLRLALAEAYAAAEQPPPVYTDPALAAGSTIKAVHISELRAAVVALPFP